MYVQQLIVKICLHRSGMLSDRSYNPVKILAFTEYTEITKYIALKQIPK